MLAMQDEINMIQLRGAGQTNGKAGQTDAEIIRAGTCKYCWSSQHTKKMSSIWHDVCRMWLGGTISVQCGRAPRRRLSRREEQSNGQTNQVKSNHFNDNYKYRKTCMETKISTISFYYSIDIRFKLDTGKSKNDIPFHLYKRLFPKVDSRYIKQPNHVK